MDRNSRTRTSAHVMPHGGKQTSGSRLMIHCVFWDCSRCVIKHRIHLVVTTRIRFCTTFSNPTHQDLGVGLTEVRGVIVKTFRWSFLCWDMKQHGRHMLCWEDAAMLFLERSGEKTGKMRSLGETTVLAGSWQPLWVLSGFRGRVQGGGGMQRGIRDRIWP